MATAAIAVATTATVTSGTGTLVKVKEKKQVAAKAKATSVQTVTKMIATETSTGSRQIRGMHVVNQKIKKSRSCYLDATRDSDEGVETIYDKIEENNQAEMPAETKTVEISSSSATAATKTMGRNRGNESSSRIKR